MRRILGLVVVSAWACVSERADLSQKPAAPPPTPLSTPVPASPAPAEMLRVSGDRIFDGNGKNVILRGIAFGNQVWTDAADPRLHHSEVDYARVKDLGMNTVRFYMNHITFDDAASPGQLKPSGLAWLDDNIAWAKKQGIYLVLNLHVPPGGYQSSGEGTELWDNPKAQDQFVALWKALADHYRAETTIAGFDLLNEPVVTKSIDQWKSLAERTIAAVRTVDPWHMMFVERVNSVGHDWKENTEQNFFRVQDPNIVYEFHFYKPFNFTHQNAPWAEMAAADTHYPDPNVASIDWFNEQWAAGTFNSPRLPAGDSDWKFYQGAPFTVTNNNLVLGKPALACVRNSGKAWFDDLTLEELDTKGIPKRTIWKTSLDSTRGWYYWTKDGSGAASNEPTGHSDHASVAISGSKSDANLGAEYLQFRVQPTGIYRLSGWMKGQNIPASATCQIRLDFYSARAPVFPMDKSFVTYELDAYVNWGKRQHVPLFLGEFGAIHQTFEGDRGGVRWVSDLLDLILERQLSFTYHTYHESSFGLYYGDNSLPDPANANQALLALFKSKLGATSMAK